MGPVFSIMVLIVTILAAFMVGVAISRRIASGILHLMMVGRLRHKQVAPAVAVALNPAQSR